MTVLISNVTKAVNEEVEQWRARPLDEVYPNCMVKVHQDHQVLLGVNLEGG